MAGNRVVTTAKAFLRVVFWWRVLGEGLQVFGVLLQPAFICTILAYEHLIPTGNSRFVSAIICSLEYVILSKLAIFVKIEFVIFSSNRVWTIIRIHCHREVEAAEL